MRPRLTLLRPLMPHFNLTEDPPDMLDVAVEPSGNDDEPDPMDRYNDEDANAEIFGDFEEDKMVDEEMDATEIIAEADGDDMAVSSCMEALADNLQLLGVSPEISVGYAAQVAKTSTKASFTEIYGRGGFLEANKALPSLNLEGLGALDLATFKPNGQPWMFPMLLIARLPCASWMITTQIGSFDLHLAHGSPS